MECREYERLFEKYFNREITILEYKAVRSHLSRCQTCREVFFDHLFTLDLLNNMPMEESANPLTERVLQRLPKKNGKINWRQWTMGAVACAVLALTLTVVEQTVDRDNHGVNASLVASTIKSQMKLGKRSVVMPNNTVIQGNLHVNGDAVVLGKVYGQLQANRVILVRQEDADLFWMIGERIKRIIPLKPRHNTKER
jgi:hypothetical protein